MMFARAAQPRPIMEERMLSMDDKMPTIVLTPDNAIQSLDAFAQCTALDDPSSSCCSSDFPVLTATCVVSSLSSQTVLYGQDEQKEVKSLRRAAFVSATVIKPTKSTKVGLVLEKVNGRLSIASISPKSLLSDAPFEVGDKLISFNNVDCSNKSAFRVATMLQRTTGVLTIVVEHPDGDPKLVESMIMKATPTSKTGLGLVAYFSHQIKVSRIDPNEIFASSLLSRQDTILSINGVPCEYIPNATEAAKMIFNSEKIVTVVAERKSDNAVVVALAA